MTDLKTLHDAFAELERRADVESAHRPADLTFTHTPARSRRPLVAAGSVALAVAAVAVTATVVTTSWPGHDRSAAAGGSSAPSSGRTTVPAHAAFTVPTTPQELADRFRTVLDGMASFTVTDTSVTLRFTPFLQKLPSNEPGSPVSRRHSVSPTASGSARPNGAAIVGTLSAGGLRGGFDLQIFRAGVGTAALCDDPDRAHCTVRPFAGGSLAIGEETLPDAAAGVTYLASYVRADGAEILMHVSNETSPKGDGALLADRPPLTTEQLTTIVTSDRW